MIEGTEITLILVNGTGKVLVPAEPPVVQGAEWPVPVSGDRLGIRQSLGPYHIRGNCPQPVGLTFAYRSQDQGDEVNYTFSLRATRRKIRETSRGENVQLSISRQPNGWRILATLR